MVNNTIANWCIVVLIGSAFHSGVTFERARLVDTGIVVCSVIIFEVYSTSVLRESMMTNIITSVVLRYLPMIQTRQRLIGGGYSTSLP